MNDSVLEEALTQGQREIKLKYSVFEIVFENLNI